MSRTRLAPAKTHPRKVQRRHVALPGRLTWKDASGAVRFASVVTRDVSESGVFVDAANGAAIPLYRIVQFQLERSACDMEGVPESLRDGRVLSAVWRVAPCRSSTGTPAGYALRFLVDPTENPAAEASDTLMPVAS
jgi:hypothetical protein